MLTRPHPRAAGSPRLRRPKGESGMSTCVREGAAACSHHFLKFSSSDSLATLVARAKTAHEVTAQKLQICLGRNGDSFSLGSPREGARGSSQRGRGRGRQRFRPRFTGGEAVRPGVWPGSNFEEKNVRGTSRVSGQGGDATPDTGRAVQPGAPARVCPGRLSTSERAGSPWSLREGVRRVPKGREAVAGSRPGRDTKQGPTRPEAGPRAGAGRGLSGCCRGVLEGKGDRPQRSGARTPRSGPVRRADFPGDRAGRSALPPAHPPRPTRRAPGPVLGARNAEVEDTALSSPSG